MEKIKTECREKRSEGGDMMMHVSEPPPKRSHDDYKNKLNPTVHFLTNPTNTI